MQLLLPSGAVSRLELAQAEDQVADAEDAALLRQDMNAKHLTKAQEDAMVAAAGRRLDRAEKAYDKMKPLVNDGLEPKPKLEPLSSDLEFARREVELAQERARATTQLAEVAPRETTTTKFAVRGTPGTTGPERADRGMAERYDGNGVFNSQIFARVESAYKREFGKPLPVSAMGETAVHRALGFDHRGRVDVAVNPASPNGVWLREYLARKHIPYFAFWEAVPGKATGAHIHLGPQSTRL